MPQVILYPAVSVDDGAAGRSVWTYNGAPGEAFKNRDDIKFASCNIPLGSPDSQGIYGRTYRNLDGSVFSWANRTITGITLRFCQRNEGPQAFISWALYVGDTLGSWFIECLNAQLSQGVGGAVLNTDFVIPSSNPNYANLHNSIKTLDNLQMSAIFYNHSLTNSTGLMDAMLAVVDYTENVPASLLFGSEI